MTNSGSTIDKRVLLYAVLRSHGQYVGDLDRLSDGEVDNLIDFWSGEAARNSHRIRAARHLIATGKMSAAGLAALEVADLNIVLDGTTTSA
ncbi:hypothetical protein ACEXQB_010140 [Herbiconiux sp. P18]|uniref:hypothetical protein n=1 Tax=Herbiconiux liangxiaofengii TaxID=3342795 RepID=UPI0035B73084